MDQECPARSCPPPRWLCEFRTTSATVGVPHAWRRRSDSLETSAVELSSASLQRCAVAGFLDSRDERLTPLRRRRDLDLSAFLVEASPRMDNARHLDQLALDLTLAIRASHPLHVEHHDRTRPLREN